MGVGCGGDGQTAFGSLGSLGGYRAGRSEFQEVAGRRAGRVRAAVTPTTGAKRSEGAVPAGKQRRKTTHPVATRRAGRAPIPGRVPPRSG